MTLAAVAELARAHRLDVFGVCHTEAEDKLGTGTLVLLGPAEPGFWQHVSATDEFQDGGANALDRWSTRVVGTIAQDVGGQALFPFGEPSRPFIGWALRSKRAWLSPVGLLVHDRAGLLVSYRGAVLLDAVLELPEARESPCNSCSNQPCRTVCPVGALGTAGYDLAACHGYLDTDAGQVCLSGGCRVRHICPVSQTYPRSPQQSAFHMAAFHG
ncbi:MAG: ferredoxin [Paracoccaceae bacterium]|nr:ferredoxin [Paracoccaceae bacterium]